jgi:CelD/BcsL family acetyltransferase involved in cellulose biosynthesis
MLNSPASAEAHSGAHIELIQSLQAIEKMRAEWDELYTRAPASTPLQSPAWVLPWAHHYAPERLLAVSVRNRGALVAFVPFFTWQGRLLLAGTGPTDYCDGLFAPGESHAGMILRHLAGAALDLGCEAIDLQQLPWWSPLVHAKSPGSWKTTLLPGDTCTVVTLEPGVCEAVASRKWRKGIARSLRALQRTAPTDLELFRTGLFEGAAQVLRRLHRARWNQRGSAGVLDDPLMTRFLDSVLPELSHAGLLRLHVLRTGAEPIAALLVLQGHGMSCFYIGGFDPEWARYSPGSIAFMAAMRMAASEGSREFHFLRGRESYKYHFGAHDVVTYRRVLEPTQETCSSSDGRNTYQQIST